MMPAPFEPARAVTQGRPRPGARRLESVTHNNPNPSRMKYGLNIPESAAVDTILESSKHEN
jgi:hypothetical protein